MVTKLPRANVPSHQTNAFTERGLTTTRCGLLPNYFGHNI